MPIATCLNGSWSVVNCKGREGVGFISKNNNQPARACGRHKYKQSAVRGGGGRSGKEEEGEGERTVVLLLFILRRCNHSNRNGGEDSGCHCTNHCFANKMVIDIVVQVGGSGDLCLVTKVTLVVVNRRSRSNSAINLWGRGNTSKLPIRSSAWVRRIRRRKKRRRRRCHPSPLAFDSANTAIGAKVTTATVVAEMVDDEG